nr:carboxypeptidase-like regulatory domain-containing protein [Pedobacter sp. MR2016-19]
MSRVGFDNYKPSPVTLSETVVAAEPAIGSSKIAFSGNVVDQSNGQPVQGAVVKLAGSKNVTATDSKGYFYLPADSNAKDKDLLINAIGFKELPVAGLQDPNAIKTALSGNKSLNEIALITGSNGHKKENIAAPKITLRAEQNLDGKSAGDITKPIPVSTINYSQYLEKNNKLYNPKGPEQFVILSFKVKSNGRPANIAVIKSLNRKADSEAKRLIQKGPDWVLPKNGTDLVEISVKF